MKKFKPEDIKCKCGHDWVTEEKDSHPYLCHECGFDSKTHTYNFKALNDWKMSQNPYTEERNLNVIKRTFSESVDEHELTWHRDKKDRVVKLLSETDWMIQFDNELPIKMNVNETITIPKNIYHRVVKGKGDLVVEITEIDEEVIDEIACWSTHHKEGTKKSKVTGKRVNNCVKNESIKESIWNINPMIISKSK